MIQKEYKVLKCDVNKDEIIDIFKEAIRKDKRYDDEMIDDLITVDEGYYIYCFYYGVIKDLEYLVIQNKNQNSGKIDVECGFYSPMFLINNLDKKGLYRVVDSIDDFKIYNVNDIEKEKEKFLKRIIEKAECSIYKRHNVKNKGVDVAPIKNFIEFKQEFYLEKVFKIHYRAKEKRKDLVSIYSGVKKQFYQLDFVHSETYENFYRKYRFPICYIPNFLKDLYYQKSFDVYLDTLLELEYIKEDELLKKIKNNIEYVKHPKYNEYLNKGIFYFKKKSYLNKYQISNDKDLKSYLLDLYLTLSYNPSSGYKLAEYIKLGIGEKADLKEFLKVLNKSYSLGNLEAKKKLFEHYLEPKYYDDYYLKRYS